MIEDITLVNPEPLYFLLGFLVVFVVFLILITKVEKMNKDELKFSKGDVIVYKETCDEYRVIGVERSLLYGGLNYLLLDRYYRIFSYHWDFVEKEFDYKKEMVVVEKEEYDFATTLMEYSM